MRVEPLGQHRHRGRGVGVEVDDEEVADVVPRRRRDEARQPGLGPGDRVALHAIISRLSRSEHGGELVDPARSQYREFFIVVNALLDGEEVTTCPYIWVDRDFSLARGWIQGFPKKLGSIWVTRTFGLDCAADPGVKPGAVLGGTVAANDRRIAQGSVTLERVSDSGPTHNDPPLVNVRHFPRLAAGRHDEPAVHELVRARSRDRSIAAVWEGDAAGRYGSGRCR